MKPTFSEFEAELALEQSLPFGMSEWLSGFRKLDDARTAEVVKAANEAEARLHRCTEVLDSVRPVKVPQA